MKKTKREFYEEIKNLLTDKAQIEFVESQIKAIDNRNEKVKEKRAEKAGNAGADIQARALTVLTDAGRAITLPELVAGVANGDVTYTSSKVVYYIRPLIEDGTIVKEKVKVGDRKVMSYKVAE